MNATLPEPKRPYYIKPTRRRAAVVPVADWQIAQVLFWPKANSAKKK